MYKVVVNHEEQYSIWPADLSPPKGWTEAGRAGSLDEAVTDLKRLTTEA